MFAAVFLPQANLLLCIGEKNYLERIRVIGIAIFIAQVPLQFFIENIWPVAFKESSCFNPTEFVCCRYHAVQMVPEHVELASPNLIRNSQLSVVCIL